MHTYVAEKTITELKRNYLQTNQTTRAAASQTKQQQQQQQSTQSAREYICEYIRKVVTMYVVPDAGTNLDNGSIVQSIFGSSVLLFSRFRKRKTAHEGTSIHTIDKL